MFVQDLVSNASYGNLSSAVRKRLDDFFPASCLRIRVLAFRGLEYVWDIIHLLSNV